MKKCRKAHVASSTTIIKRERRNGHWGVTRLTMACVLITSWSPLSQRQSSSRIVNICKNHYPNPGTLYENFAVHYPWTQRSL